MSIEYYQNLPKKRMGAGALLFNSAGEVLIVKPTYKEGWSIPGGVVDQDESPCKACIREVKEEIGLDIKSPRFIGLFYYKNSENKGDNLQFMFL